MAMYAPQKKHRAHHGNYYRKPTKNEVESLMKLYANVSTINRITPTKKVVGVQLKLKL